MKKKLFTIKNDYFNFFLAYFASSLVVELLYPIVSSVTGISGFSFTPIANTMFSIVVFFLVYGQIFLDFINKKYPKIDKIGAIPVCIISCMIIIGVIFGLVARNSNEYILSTTIYWLNFLGICLLAPKLVDIKFEKWSLWLLCISSVIFIIMGWARTQTSLYCLVFAAIYFVYRKNIIWGMVGLTPFLLRITNLNRAIILSTVATFFLIALSTRKYISMSIVVFLSLFSFYLIQNIDLNSVVQSDTLIYRRLSEVQNLLSGKQSTDDMTAIQQRLYEMRLVNEKLNSKPFGWVFGGGFGQTVDMSGSRDDAVKGSALLGKSEVHNIHSLPHSILLRSGLLGISLLVWLLAQSGLNALNALRVKDLDNYTLFCIVYPVASLVYALPAANYFLTDFIVIGLTLVASMRLRRLPKRQPAYIVRRMNRNKVAQARRL